MAREKRSYYRANQWIFFEDSTGFQKYEDGRWVSDFRMFHMDNLEPISEEEAQEALAEQEELAYNRFLKARAMAKEAHKGQKDKAEKDYFESHILPVYHLVPKSAWLGLIALLHDTLEDTDLTFDDIWREIDPLVAETVRVLTRQDGETYEEYIERIKDSEVAKYAVPVKICDLIQNMDLSRLPVITEEDKERQRKYMNALINLSRFWYKRKEPVFRISE